MLRLILLTLQSGNRMNDLIKRLAIQAGAAWRAQPPHFSNTDNPIDFPQSANAELERFAEAIVRECLTVARGTYTPVLEDHIRVQDPHWDGYAQCGVDVDVAIQDHFGFREDTLSDKHTRALNTAGIFAETFRVERIDSTARDAIDDAFAAIEPNILRYSTKIVGEEIWLSWFPTGDSKIEIIYGSGGATVSTGELV